MAARETDRIGQSYLATYIEVSEELTIFAYQLAAFHEFANDEEARFERLNGAVSKLGSERAIDNPFIAPEILAPKLCIVRALIDRKKDPSACIEQTVQAAILLADVGNLRAELIQWVRATLEAADSFMIYLLEEAARKIDDSNHFEAQF
jgi:hypothetical protein